MKTLTIIPPTPAEQAVIERAEAVLARVEADSFPWPEPGRKAISLAAYALRNCLDCHESLRDGSLHPASEFPDLGDGRDDAMGVALSRVTADISDWTEALVMVVAEHCGDRAARYVEHGEQEAAA
jgi:hypothetical protein